MKPWFMPFSAVFLVFVMGGSIPVLPQSPGDVSVILENSESLRTLAREYLGESNDWELILYYNGLKSIDGLKTGQRLWIPVQKFRDVSKGIADCQQAVIAANAEGAGILVPIVIELAIENLNRAVQLKKQGDLKSAEKTVQQALAGASKALAETREKRLQAVTAVLAEMRGTVQFRAVDALQWKDAVLRQELAEKDRLRTLSRSYGNILFIDGSRIQMDENALIVIETVDKDVLKNASSVDILVLEGDVTTLINSLQASNQFKVKSPGVSTGVRSRSFLTSRDRERTTRFSNFEGELDVASNGKQVTLARNEGTKVSYGRIPDRPKKLPPPPLPVRPSEEQALFSAQIDFRFTPAAEAEAVQIQISRNKSFNEIEKSIRIRPAQPAVWEAPQNGGYFWRICAIDRDQLQGPYSKPVSFTVQVDRVPPFLELTSPARDTVVFSDRIEIRGRAEKGAAVTVRGDTAAVSPEGDFSHMLELTGGKQTLHVEAVDRAGNRCSIQREITNHAGTELFTLDGGETILSNDARVTLSGRVETGVRIDVDGRPVETRGGLFAQALTLGEGIHNLTIRAVSPGGGVQEKNLHITVDTRPPELRLDEVAAYTELPGVTIGGSLSKPAEVTVNALPVPVTDGRFSRKIDLKEGANPVSIRARDRSGNVAEKTVTVFRDTEPPRILSYKLSPDLAKGGEMVTVSVTAVDRGVGMARTGTFVVEMDPAQKQLSGLLKLDQETGSYTGSLNVPPGCRGRLKLVKLFLSDYLGNTAVFP
jgi:hypothetical protein